MLKIHEDNLRARHLHISTEHKTPTKNIMFLQRVVSKKLFAIKTSGSIRKKFDRSLNI